MADQKITPQKPVRKLKGGTVTSIIIAVVVLVIIVSSFYTVNPYERGVVTRFGKFHKIADEGLNWKIPLGIDVVTKVTKNVQFKQFGYRTIQAGETTQYDTKNDYSRESEMLTGDLNIVDATWSIGYVISDPQAWLFNVDNSRLQGSRDEDARDKTIRDVTQSVVNQLVGDRAILDIMSTERDAIESLAIVKIQETLDYYGLGVSLTEVKMQNVVAPAGEVQNAFEDVNKATQDRERLINEGEQAYYAEIPKIEGEAKQLLAEAEGYKQSRINRAEGEVAMFKAIYEEYRNNQQVTRDRIYYETVTKILQSTENTDLIDGELDNFLPLKNLSSGEGQ